MWLLWRIEIWGGEWLFQASRHSPRATGSTQFSPVVARHLAISSPRRHSWCKACSTQSSPVVDLPNASPGHPYVRGAKGRPTYFTSRLSSPPPAHSYAHLVFLLFSRPPFISPTRTFAATRLPVTFRLRATLCSPHQSLRPRLSPFRQPAAARRVSSPRLTIRSSSRPPPSRARRAAPPARPPSTGPPGGGPRLSARRSAASRRPFARPFGPILAWPSASPAAAAA